jgi:hypothetical protein
MGGTDRRAIRQRVDPANSNGSPPFDSAQGRLGRALPNRQSIIVEIFPSPAYNLIFYREILRK